MAGENNNFGNFRFPATPQFTPPPAQFDPYYTGVFNNMQGPAVWNTGAFNFLPDPSRNTGAFNFIPDSSRNVSRFIS